MRKLLALLLVFVMLFSVITLISGCEESSKKKGSSSNKDEDDEGKENNEDNEKDGENDNEDEVDEDDSNGSNLPGSDEQAIISQLIVEEYHYSTDWENYGLLLFENPTDYELDIEAYVTFYDSSNDELESKESSAYLGKGGQAVLEFSCSYMYAKMEYTLSVELEEWETNAAPNLSWESTIASDREIIAITNNGNKRVHNVDVTMLFWNGDKLVNTSGVWIGDIASGKIKYAELYCSDEYDRTQVVLSACYADYYDENQWNEDALVSQFEVAEYRYRDYWDYPHAVLVVTNNSDMALSVNVTVRFYNSDNQMIGVGEQYSDGFGSGERIVFDFYRTEEFAQIAYDFTVNGDAWEQSALSSVTMESVTGNGKELITITNRSKKDTVQTSATVLFWGADGALVDIEDVDFWNLEPGQSTTVEAICDVAFAEAEVILHASIYEQYGETDKDFNAQQVASKLKADFYNYEDYYGDGYLLLVVENTSTYYLEIRAEITFYDEHNNLIGAAYTDSHRVDVNNRSVLQCEVNDAYTRVEYQFQVELVRGYEAADLDMSWKEENSTITVTNDGNRTISDIRGYAVFWKDGKVVYYDTLWYWELESGGTMTHTHYCEDYDSLDVFLLGSYPVEYRYELQSVQPLEG